MYMYMYISLDSTEHVLKNPPNSFWSPSPPPEGYDRPKVRTWLDAKLTQQWPKAAQLSSKQKNKKQEIRHCSKKLNGHLRFPLPSPSQTAIQPLTLYSLGLLCHGLDYMHLAQSPPEVLRRSYASSRHQALDSSKSHVLSNQDRHVQCSNTPKL